MIEGWKETRVRDGERTVYSYVAIYDDQEVRQGRMVIDRDVRKRMQWYNPIVQGLDMRAKRVGLGAECQDTRFPGISGCGSLNRSGNDHARIAIVISDSVD